MTDKSGLKAAREKDITLGEIGQRIVLENEHVRIWEINLAPGETIDFHLHYHPYVVVSLGGGKNEIETIFGDKRMTDEPLGSTVFINDMRPVHRLTNRDTVRYLSRLIEIKSVRRSRDRIDGADGRWLGRSYAHRAAGRRDGGPGRRLRHARVVGHIDNLCARGSAASAHRGEQARRSRQKRSSRWRGRFGATAFVSSRPERCRLPRLREAGK